MLPRFVKALHEVYSGITEEDIADILWLALHIQSSQSGETALSSQQAGTKPDRDQEQQLAHKKNHVPSGQPSSSPKPSAEASQQGRCAQLHLPSQSRIGMAHE